MAKKEKKEKKDKKEKKEKKPKKEKKEKKGLMFFLANYYFNFDTKSLASIFRFAI